MKYIKNKDTVIPFKNAFTVKVGECPLGGRYMVTITFLEGAPNLSTSMTTSFNLKDSILEHIQKKEMTKKIKETVFEYICDWLNKDKSNVLELDSIISYVCGGHLEKKGK